MWKTARSAHGAGDAAGKKLWRIEPGFPQETARAGGRHWALPRPQLFPVDSTGALWSHSLLLTLLVISRTAETVGSSPLCSSCSILRIE